MSGILGIVSLGVSPKVSLADIPSSVDELGIEPDNITISITLESDGDIIVTRTLSGTVDLGDWILPKAFASSAYEARMTVNSGSVSGGTTGSWLAMSSDRSWSQVRNSPGVQTANVTLEIRRNGGVVRASKTFDFTATVSL